MVPSKQSFCTEILERVVSECVPGLRSKSHSPIWSPEVKSHLVNQFIGLVWTQSTAPDVLVGGQQKDRPVLDLMDLQLLNFFGQLFLNDLGREGTTKESA